MRNEHDVSQQLHRRRQKLLALVVAIVLVAGVGAYFLQMSTRHSPSLLEPSTQKPSVDAPLPVTPGWKLLRFQSKEMHFTLQYPSNLSLEEKEYRRGDRILFDSQNPNGRHIGLEISYAGDDTLNDRSSNDVLFNALVGNVPTENIQGYGDTVITKIADLTINGHRAVYATFFRKGSTYQEPRFCESYIVRKDRGHEYLLDACTTDGTSYSELQAKVTPYSSLIGQIVSTFTIQ